MKCSFLMQCDDVITNSRWRTDAVLKIVFRYISEPYRPLMARNSDGRWKITCRYRSRDQNCNFRNSGGRTAAILKIALSRYLSRELSDFNQTCYADANYHSDDGHLTKNRSFFKFKMSDGRHNENRFFPLYLGAILHGRLMRNSDRIWRIMQVGRYRSRYQNGNFSTLKMADGRHVENSFQRLGMYVILWFF